MNGLPARAIGCIREGELGHYRVMVRKAEICVTLGVAVNNVYATEEAVIQIVAYQDMIQHLQVAFKLIGILLGNGQRFNQIVQHVAF